MQEEKDLNTYDDNICSEDTSFPLYQGLKIFVSHSAMAELVKEGKTLHFIVDILENGYGAPRKRKENTIEKWIDKGNKTFNAVIAKNYEEYAKKECWVLIHFGKFTKLR